VGFAWTPNTGFGALSGAPGQHSFVIRGGFGVYYNRGQAEGTQENSADPPFSLNSLGAAGLGGNPSFANLLRTLPTLRARLTNNPFPTQFQSQAECELRLSLSSGMDNLTSAYDVPYTYNFNLNVQHALPSTWC